MTGRRRNPLHGRQPLIVLVISLLSGVGAVWSGASPTGSTLIDALLVGIAAIAVTWSAGTAPWWAPAVACGVAAAAAAPQWLLVVAGLAGVALAAQVGAGRRNQPWARSLATLAAVQVFARLHLYGFIGLSALLGCATLAVVFVLGVRRRSRTVRKRTWTIVASIGAMAFCSLLGVVLAASGARGPLSEGNRQARSGLTALNRGDFEAATAAFRGAADSFARANDELGAVWAVPSRLLPVVSQNREATLRLAAAGERTMRAAAETVASIDPDSVRVRDGRIDLDAVRALEQPFTDLRAEIGRLGAEVDAVDPMWLAGPIQRRLDDLSDDIDRNATLADNALEAVRLAPDMLGGNGVRRYFIAFTTPAEARGLGGFMGNYAEITVDEGHIQMTKFGRHTDLTEASDEPHRLTMSEDVAGTYGGYGFVSGVDGTANHDIWQVVTMVPDYPTVAGFIAELYPQSGGLAVDGVFMLDPEAIAALIGFTGPITIDGVDKPITAKNAATFIIQDQYKVEQLDERLDLLSDIAETTVDTLLSSTLPPPTDLAKAFAPLAAEHRFMAWARDADEEAFLSRVGMGGEFPQLAGGDGLAVAVDNAGANKIDAYLDVKVEYAEGPIAADGSVAGTATVTLTNNAPSAGLPRIVIDNAFGLPLGTNRVLLSVYSALGPNSATLDGSPHDFRFGRAFGWFVSFAKFDIPPGATRTLVLEVNGYLQDRSQPFVTRVQPLVRPAELTVDVG